MKCIALFLVALLSACSSTPPPPDWQMNAQQSMERAVNAYLEGNVRVHAAELARAKSEVARTGRADLMARVELANCAAAVASLVQEDCKGFEALRADAAPAERAYAAYLTAAASDVAALPAQHRAAAAANGDVASAEAVKAIADPLARLIAAGVVFRRGNASPQLIDAAVDTASAQGFRRALLAWLGVAQLRAEKAGDAEAAARVKRRIELITQNTKP
jgi:hypothetical protein